MTGTGTLQDPIIAMSGDPATIARDVRASLAHYGRTDDPYWVEKESAPAQFSNGLWFLGHNRYWEARQDPNNPGSADPNLGRQPAEFGLTVTVPAPPGTVVPPVDPSPATIASITLSRVQVLETQLASVVAVLEDLNTRVAAVSSQIESLSTHLTTLALKVPPNYSARIFGATITLTPAIKP